IQVLYSFFIYLSAASGAGEKLLGLLLMQDGAINGIVAWLSIATTGTLPVFLFYTLRALAETIWPGLRVTRLSEASELIGPTTYTISEQGVHAARSGGTEISIPWTAFDEIRSDSEIVALIARSRLRFFVPLSAFGAERDQVAA